MTTQVGADFFSIEELEKEPWRNGGGVTRTVARSDVDGLQRWRISVADIARDAAFSTFPGLDREAVLLRGAGVTLRGPGGAWIMTRPGESARFPGEMPIRGSQDGQGARLWNVMASREQVRMRTDFSRAAQARVGPVAEGALLVLEGFAEVGWPGGSASIRASVLGAGEGLRFDRWDEVLTLHFLSPAAHWLLTTFEQR